MDSEGLVYYDNDQSITASLPQGQVK